MQLGNCDSKVRSEAEKNMLFLVLTESGAVEHGCEYCGKLGNNPHQGEQPCTKANGRGKELCVNAVTAIDAQECNLTKNGTFVCYKCEQTGHFARDCKAPLATPAPTASGAPQQPRARDGQQTASARQHGPSDSSAGPSARDSRSGGRQGGRGRDVRRDGGGSGGGNKGRDDWETTPNDDRGRERGYGAARPQNGWRDRSRDGGRDWDGSREYYRGREDGGRGDDGRGRDRDRSRSHDRGRERDGGRSNDYRLREENEMYRAYFLQQVRNGQQQQQGSPWPPSGPPAPSTTVGLRPPSHTMPAGRPFNAPAYAQLPPHRDERSVHLLTDGHAGTGHSGHLN